MSTKKASLREASQGVLQALPVATGYLPVAFAFGLLASQAGLSFLPTVSMSILVYAGASQFIALGMLKAGAGLWPIVLATFTVNLRHLLMAAAIAPRLRSWAGAKRILFGLQMTDEVFALHATNFETRTPQPPAVLAANLAAHLSWVAGTVLGFFFAARLGDVRPLGLDFALPAGLQLWLRQIPTAILAALLAQSILLEDSRLCLTSGNLHLWAAALAFLVAYRTKSMLWTVGAGMAGLAALRWVLGS